MIAFTLFIITIGGIAAAHQDKSLGLNISTKKYLGSDFENLNRAKRQTTRNDVLRGDQYSFTFDMKDSEINVLGTLFNAPPVYHYNKFMITRDLNITSWDQLLATYTWADFNTAIHIEFSRPDKQGRIVDVRIIPDAIELRKIRKSNQDIEPFYDTKFTYYTYPKQGIVEETETKPIRDIPFMNYSQKIFDESIWVGAARVNAKVYVTLEGYMKNNELILQLVYKLSHSYIFSSSGMNFKMHHFNELVLK